MDIRKLGKLRRKYESLRRAPQKALALQRLAKTLGRVKVNRGKEPMWENQIFSHLRPLSIPDHGAGRDLPTETKNSVLIQLEDDLIAWEEKLNDEASDDE